MKRAKNKVFIIIAIVTLFVAVSAATYAYFVASGNVDSTSAVNITTSPVDSVAGGSTNCSMEVTASDMQYDNGTADGVAKTTSCTVSIIGTKTHGNNQPTTCTYDITYTPTNALTIRSSENTSNKKELSLKGLGNIQDSDYGSGSPLVYEESDLYNVTTKTTLVSQATFTFIADNEITWTFTPSFYNYNFNQNDLANHSFGGRIAIENVSCSSDMTSSSSALTYCDPGTSLVDCIKDSYVADGVNNLYYHSPSNTSSAQDRSYRYAGSDYTAEQIINLTYDFYVPAGHMLSGSNSELYNITTESNYLMGVLVNNGLISINGTDATLLNGNTYDITNQQELYNATLEAIDKGYIVGKVSYVPAKYNGDFPIADGPYSIADMPESEFASMATAEFYLYEYDSSNHTFLFEQENLEYNLLDASERSAAVNKMLELHYIESIDIHPGNVNNYVSFGGGGQSYDYFVPAVYNNGTDSQTYNLNTNAGANSLMQIMILDGLVSINGEECTILNGGTYNMNDSSQLQAGIAEAVAKGYIVNVVNSSSLYRIIGVFNVTTASGETQELVKLVKADYATSTELGTGGDYNSSGWVDYTNSWVARLYRGSNSSFSSYYWSHANAQTARDETGIEAVWSYSALNTVNLNNYYLNSYLPSTYRNMIENVKWTPTIISEDDLDNLPGLNAKYIYTGEITLAGSYRDNYTARVGLMYASDYAYANSDWNVYQDSVIAVSNWLHLGLFESFLPAVDHDWSFMTGVLGDLGALPISASFLVRPTFYLKSNVEYVSGNGTKTNPFVIQ
jgi:hypothetical protein